MSASVASIQLFTSALIASDDFPRLSIARPMLTVIVPGYFMNCRRGQKSPALWATGMTGTPVSLANNAPPDL
jgi:hypothetical protein